MADTKINSAGEQQPVDKQSRYAKMNGQASHSNDGEEKKAKTSKCEKAVGFASKERKYTAHHQRHAKELGYRNQDEYEKAAVAFFNSDRGKLYYSEARDRYYRYDEKSRELVVSSGGMVHTYYKLSKKQFERIFQQEKLRDYEED